MDRNQQNNLKISSFDAFYNSYIDIQLHIFKRVTLFILQHIFYSICPVTIPYINIPSYYNYYTHNFGIHFKGFTDTLDYSK